MYRQKRRQSFINEPDDDHFDPKFLKPEKESLETQIYKFGIQDPSFLDSELKSLIESIILEIPKSALKYAKILVKCAKNIPERISFYSSIVGLLNMKDSSFGELFLGEFIRELRDNIKDNSFNNVKFMLRFLADSTNCGFVDPGSFLSLLENFAEAPGDTFSTSQTRADWYAFLILYCLPHCGQILSAQDENLLNCILNTIECYLSRRNKLHVDILRVWNSDDPHPQEDYLDVLWLQISSLRDANWIEKVSWKLHYTLPSLLQHGKPHSFNPISPPDFDQYVTYPLPKVVFRLFDYTDVIDLSDSDEDKNEQISVLPGSHTIERFLFDDQIQIIIDSCNFSRKFCAKTLLEIETKASVALDYMIVEQIYGSMFQLPHPLVTHGQLLFFGSLIIELCHESTTNMPLILAQATETIFERLDRMKPVCIERFVNWFSYHLTNYQMQWTWKSWAYALKENRMSPRKRVIAETFSRLVRFSYFENVRSRIPRQFQVLLPPEPKFMNRYGGLSSLRLASSTAFSKVLAAIRNRIDADDLIEMVEECCEHTLKVSKASTKIKIKKEPIEEGNSDESSNSDSSSSSDEDEEMKVKQEPMDDSRMDDNPPDDSIFRAPPVSTFRNREDNTPFGLKRMDTTPNGLHRMDNTPHAINPQRMDNTPHAINRVPSPLSRNRDEDDLPRTKFDDDDDVVNYERHSNQRNKKIMVARRFYTRPNTDQTDSQEGVSNRTPSIARNASPPRNQNTADENDEDKGMEKSKRVLQLCDGVQDLKIEVFMSALLYCGHKTISHTFSLLKRYTNVLKKLVPQSNFQAQIDCLHLVRLAWSRQTHMCIMIVDHLFRTGFIEPEAVINWAYSDQMCAISFDSDTPEDDFNALEVVKEDDDTVHWPSRPCNARPTILEFYVWECLNGILSRVGRRVNEVSEKLEQAKNALALKRADTVSTSSSSESSDDDGSSDATSRRNKDLGRSRSRSVVTGGSSAVVARLNRERLAAVECQATCFQTLLSHHSKLMLRIEQQMVSSGPTVQRDGLDVKPLVMDSRAQVLRHIMFWLRGRLEEILLDNYSQIRPHLDTLEEFRVNHSNNAENFQVVIDQWKSLFA